MDRKTCVHTVFCLLAFFTYTTQILFSSEKTTFPHPIDIVYLWVDGNDPEWKSIKNYYMEAHQQQQQVILEEAATDNRFRDHEELRYSLRSILAFAPFFNHIYIVTMNQRPKWLIDHPQVTLVDHQEIFVNLDNLPTFNSQAIESNLHRIPGLSEHFIYFNDDVFLGLPASPYDFFTEENKIKVLFEKGMTVSNDPIVQASPYRKAWLNSSALLDHFFIRERRHRLCHAPFALRKSLIERAEQLFSFVFDQNSSNKFRCPEDFNITNGLLQYIFLYQNFAEKGNTTNKMISIRNDSHLYETETDFNNLLENPLHTFCLQDCMQGESQLTQKVFSNFLNTLFPTPAPWEDIHPSSNILRAL